MTGNIYIPVDDPTGSAFSIFMALICIGIIAAYIQIMEHREKKKAEKEKENGETDTGRIK